VNDWDYVTRFTSERCFCHTFSQEEFLRITILHFPANSTAVLVPRFVSYNDTGPTSAQIISTPERTALNQFRTQKPMRNFFTL
jgi:hypothetical protein